MGLVILLRYFYKALYATINILCGPYLSLEAAISLKYYFHSFGCIAIYYDKDKFSWFDFRFSFLLNSTLLS